MATTGRTIEFTYNGVDYSLGFNRKVVKDMERNGLTLDRISNAPLNGMMSFFEWAFVANHKRINPKTAEAIYENMADKAGLMDALVDLYMEVVDSIFGNGEDDEKNVKWTVAG